MNQHISADRLISHHRSREDYQQSPINSLQFGYGDHRYVKFTYELLNESDILKQKILKQLIDDFSLCDNVNLCLLSSDMLSVLLKHLKNKNQIIRELSAKTVRKICGSSEGVKAIMKKGCIEEIQQLVNDNLDNIRIDGYEGLLRFIQFTDGVNCLLNCQKVIPHLADKLIQEKNEIILNKTIQLLKGLTQGEKGTPQVLKTQAISRLMNLISHKYQNIRFNVCSTLANISFNEQAKNIIIQKGYINTISKYMQDPDPFVREYSCLLLCSLAQLNQGKIQILQFANFNTILNLLNDKSPTVLNAVQLIANLAQNPIGRDKAMPHINKLNSLTSIERIYIDSCLDVIKWKP